MTIHCDTPAISSINGAFALINESNNRNASIVVEHRQRLEDYVKESRAIAESLAKVDVPSYSLGDYRLGVAFKSEDLQRALKEHSNDAEVYRDVVRAMQVPFLAVNEFLNLLFKTDPQKIRFVDGDDTLDIGGDLRLTFEPRGEECSAKLKSFASKNPDASGMTYHLKPDHFAEYGPVVDGAQAPNPYGWREGSRVKSLDISDYQKSENMDGVNFQSKITLGMGIGENRIDGEPAMMSKVYFHAPAGVHVYTSNDSRGDAKATDEVFAQFPTSDQKY